MGFLRRNIMVPLLNAESYGQLTRFMLERCDGLAKHTHYRKSAPIGDLFAEERACMQPLPRVGFDAVDWQERRADRDGRVKVDGNYYLAGPSWRGWSLDVGLRAFDVQIRDRHGRRVATLPRVYGQSPTTVRDPATLLPALGRKTHAWPESTIRDDFPDKLRLAVDHMDAKERRRAFNLIAKASDACGFDAAVKAGEHLIEQGREIDEASMMMLARRIKAGESVDDTPAPDLSSYDMFMHPGDTPARREA